MKSLAQSVAAAVVLSVTGLGAQAATLTAIGEVNILGTDYMVSLLSDIDFDSQSFANLKPTITFTNLSDAQAAASALLTKFGSNYDWNPTCIGCYDGVRVAYGFDAVQYDYVTITDSNIIYGPFSISVNDANIFSFAQFTTVVPEPGTVPMMLVGLGLIALIVWRRSATHFRVLSAKDPSARVSPIVK